MKEDLGKLILRVGIGSTMLFHGISKAMHGVGFIESMLVKHGLPAFLAYGVYVGEIVAPIMLIVGFKTRIAGVIIAFNMLVAMLLVHTKDIFTVTEQGAWGIELPMLYLISGLTIALVGAGRYSMDSKTRR
jgi:putative oxidoreductase